MMHREGNGVIMKTDRKLLEEDDDAVKLLNGKIVKPNWSQMCSEDI